MRKVLMLVLAVFGFTNVAMATTPVTKPRYVYQFDLKAPKVETYITAEVCSQVGQATRFIRNMVDKQQSDRQIKDALYRSVSANLDDKTGVTVYHMLLTDGYIGQVRAIKNTSFYRDMYATDKQLSPGVIAEFWALAACQAHIGTTIKEIRVVRVQLN